MKDCATLAGFFEATDFNTMAPVMTWETPAHGCWPPLAGVTLPTG